MSKLPENPIAAAIAIMIDVSFGSQPDLVELMEDSVADLERGFPGSLEALVECDSLRFDVRGVAARILLERFDVSDALSAELLAHPSKLIRLGARQGLEEKGT